MSRTLLHPALARTVLWMLVLAAAFWTLSHIRMTLTIFGLAFLIAYLVNSPVNLLTLRYGVARGRAIALIYAVIASLGLAAAALVVPMMIDQVDRMITEMPALSERLGQVAQRVQEDYISRLPQAYQHHLAEVLLESKASAASIAKGLLIATRDLVSEMLSGIVLMVTALIVSIYVILQWLELGPGLLRVLPESYREELVQLSFELNKIFGGYLKAQLSLAFLCGILTFALLSLHSLLVVSNPYSLLIAVVAAITLPIPILNQVIPPLTAVLLTLINGGGWSHAAQAAALVYAVNILVERSLAPKVMSEAVGVSALFVLLAAFAGAELLGPLGALLGVPLAAMAKSVFVWFHRRFLIADDAEPPATESPELARLSQLEARLSRLERRQRTRGVLGGGA